MGYSRMQHLSLVGQGTQRVGTSSEVIAAPAGTKAVIIRARSTNAGLVYVGDSTVTNTVGADNGTTGLELDAGQDVEVPFGADVYIIGSAADQDVTWVALG